MTTTTIAVIGGGSTFTPELVTLLAERTAAVGEIELRLMDTDAEQLAIVSGLCERIVRKSGKPVKLVTTEDLREAISGAEFVLLQFRQGGVDARIEDEKLGLKYDLPFTETISVCGFSTFLRTYYEIERIAAAIKEVAPTAWVINFTNPAGHVAEALYSLGLRKVIGACNGSVGFLDTLSKISGYPADELFMSWKGLNHLTFVDAVYHDGENILADVLEKLDDSNLGSMTVPAALIKSLGVLPHQYLQYYFRRRAIAEKLQKQDRVRSEVVKEINGRLYEQYKTAEAMPDELKLRGGSRYSEVVAELIVGIAAGLGTVHYAVVRNNGTLSDLDDDAFVEVPVVAHREGPFPIQMGPLPVVGRSLVLAVKDYERLAIAGAAKRERSLLLNALMVHPLIGSYEVAEPLLEDCLELNRDYIPEIA